MSNEDTNKTNRRGFLGDGVRVAGALALTGVTGLVAFRRGRDRETVWQLDPDACTECGNCATYCVLDESAVKAVNCFDVCGYCNICTGYFVEKYYELDTAAENQLCPTGAIVRQFVEKKAGQRYYEYTIEEDLCIGCAKCVKGCERMNGSLYLQVCHDRCVNCNECSIAIACPAQAFHQIPAEMGEILKRTAAELMGTRAKKMRREAGMPDEKQAARELTARVERQLAWRAEQDRRQREKERASSAQEGVQEP